MANWHGTWYKESRLDAESWTRSARSARSARSTHLLGDFGAALANGLLLLVGDEALVRLPRVKNRLLRGHLLVLRGSSGSRWVGVWVGLEWGGLGVVQRGMATATTTTGGNAVAGESLEHEHVVVGVARAQAQCERKSRPIDRTAPHLPRVVLRRRV